LNKQTYRKFYIQQRISLHKFQVDLSAEEITKKLILNQKIINSKNIGLYYAYKNEIDLNLFFQHCLEKQKNCYFPKCISNKLLFAKATKSTIWQHNKFNILEPQNTETKSLKHLDCIILPAISVDTDNYRLGSGCGFYDKTLKKSQIYKIGVIYQFQLCDKLPCDKWDVPLDCVYAA
jgi:5-formyltetrahydrofolate cyclo-ligase